MSSIPVFQSRGDIPSSFWRPPFQFSYLPPQLKWEATRRHPVYLISWQHTNAGTLLDKEGKASLPQKVVDFSRMLLLGAVGVNAELACAPSKSFEELGELNPAWLSGAVQPLSFGKIATLLLTHLPKETLAYLGMKFVEAGLDDVLDLEGNPLSRQLKAVQEIQAAGKEKLDSLCPDPFLSIAPGASKRQVDRDTHMLLDQWKDRFDLDEMRVRSEKLNDYLLVWDLREGWEAGAYVSGKAKTLKEVAIELNRPLTTVHSQFKSAFKFITGHDYGFATYLEIFGWYRFRRMEPTQNGLRYRRTVETTLRPVTETRLASNLASAAADLERSALSCAVDLKLDFEALLSSGKSESEAADELGVSDLKAYYSLVDLLDYES